MKTTIKYLVALLFAFVLSIGYHTAAPLAVFNYKVFYIPGKGPIVETYFDFYGKSVVLSESESPESTGKVEISLIFKKGENIVSWDKKILETPAMTKADPIDFLDIQRFALPPGEYVLEIEIKDLNDSEGAVMISEQEIVVDQPKDILYFSDLQLVSAYKKATEIGPYTKSGYDLLPMVSDDYAPATMNEIVLYGELYGAGTLWPDNEPFVISTVLEDAQTLHPLEGTRKYSRKEAAEVNSFIASIDISKVKEGDYVIAVEARDKENQVRARKTHKLRRNFAGPPADFTKVDQEQLAASWVSMYDSKQELYEYVQALRPIANTADLFVLANTFSDVSKAELSHLQQYFYTFWDTQKEGDGEMAWLEYREKLAFVEQEFGTRNKRGYNTDRGRIWLQYGPPDDITDRPSEPSSYPYQIWRYYKAGQWNNVRFIFYDTTLLAEDYELLHSDNIPGELKNPQWKLLLEQRNTPMNNVDQREGREHLGGRIDMLFENPR